MTLEYAQDPGCPAVVTWFVVYCAFMALMYGIIAVVGAVILTMPAARTQASTPAEAIVQGVIMLALCLPLAGVFGVAPFLPRRPWVWIYNLVLICLGLTSVCCMPVTIPLLIFWIKPAARVWFGRSA